MRKSLCWITYRQDQADRFFPLGIMRNQARVLTILGEWPRAEEIYRLILATMRQSGDRKQEAEAQPEVSSRRGEIMHQLWKCTGKEEYRLRAVAIYKKLAEGKNCSYYQKAIRELDV